MDGHNYTGQVLTHSPQAVHRDGFIKKGSSVAGQASTQAQHWVQTLLSRFFGARGASVMIAPILEANPWPSTTSEFTPLSSPIPACWPIRGKETAIVVGLINSAR